MTYLGAISPPRRPLPLCCSPALPGAVNPHAACMAACVLPEAVAGFSAVDRAMVVERCLAQMSSPSLVTLRAEWACGSVGCVPESTREVLKAISVGIHKHLTKVSGVNACSTYLPLTIVLTIYYTVSIICNLTNPLQDRSIQVLQVLIAVIPQVIRIDILHTDCCILKSVPIVSSSTFQVFLVICSRYIVS
ncbi:hypothetical protein FOMPIDRAFT_115980 [Fomitopsis schrenkii]|uniref:Uncharacterized protein n=1 Tax=Fomitopsis schrenkii TaxID=2126942 RepID=S8EB47_FOMSC|nr:hypothetical protein FOMPIDRAFT_115980 [Fomitopsis schrenkii]